MRKKKGLLSIILDNFHLFQHTQCPCIQQIFTEYPLMPGAIVNAGNAALKKTKPFHSQSLHRGVIHAKI